jgi:hypothetical protein
MTPLSTEDRAELTDTVRRLLQKHAPLESARAPYDGGEAFDRDTWRRLADELGVVALQAAEESGGQGCSLTEVAAVATELGAVLARTPYVWSSGVVVSALTYLGETTVSEQLAGGRIASYASGFTATADRVSGAVPRVPWAGVADWLVVLADEGGTPVLLAVETAGLVRTDRQSFDRTVPLADLSAEDVPALVLARGEAAAEAARFGEDCGAVVLAAELVGAAGTLLDRAVRYAKDRHQFGKPIGAQQAVKHQLADVAVELELARAAVTAALPHLHPGADRTRAVATAKALASDMALKAADTGLHVHGGMGFTWEQESHLFLRRARFASGAFGDPRRHRGAYLDSLLGGVR